MSWNKIDYVPQSSFSHKTLRKLFSKELREPIWLLKQEPQDVAAWIVRSIEPPRNIVCYDRKQQLFAVYKKEWISEVYYPTIFRTILKAVQDALPDDVLGLIPNWRERHPHYSLDIDRIRINLVELKIARDSPLTQTELGKALLPALINLQRWDL